MPCALQALRERWSRGHEVIENFVRQVRVIFLGAAAWRERGR
jgi:hypothetical protein